MNVAETLPPSPAGTPLKIGPTEIDDTFAEAFGMRYSRLIITAHDAHWLDAALREFTGFGSSVIACDLELGREVLLPPEQTPDGRPGAAVLCFGFSQDALAKAIAVRAGQCLMTSPARPSTTVCRRPRHGFRWASTCDSSATDFRKVNRSAAGATGASR